MKSDHKTPINIGSDRLISINQMVKIISKIANKNISCNYDLTKPQGVRGRNSDNTNVKKILKWQPIISLEEGLEKTYSWINDQLNK